MFFYSCVDIKLFVGKDKAQFESRPGEHSGRQCTWLCWCRRSCSLQRR